MKNEENKRKLLKAKKKKVVVSLYRGNLFRSLVVSWCWLMPIPEISLKDFKSLFHRCNKALSGLCSSSSSFNPNPSRELNLHHSPMLNGPPIKVKVEVDGGTNGGNCSFQLEDEGHKKGETLEVDEKPPEDSKANVKVNEFNGKEKRRRDVEEKLQVLNAKKHNLVLVLKQEELKIRNNTQGTTICLAVPIHVEMTIDSGLMTRLVVTPRMGSEANLAGEDGGEVDVSNLNIHFLRFQISCTSPSSESRLRRPTHVNTMWSYLSDVTGSPLRFAPTGNQGHPGNSLAVSVSGTNYVASPSPAASGGSSVFKEAQHRSPWN